MGSCSQCKAVTNEPPKSKRHPWAWPSGPMDRVHFDFFGLFNGKNYLVMVDSYSKWCEVTIMNNVKSESTIDVCRNLFSRYGLSNQVVTDNGTQFMSNEFETFCVRNGINHIPSVHYHQSSNGQVERFVQTIKKGLKMNKGDIQEKLVN